MGESCTCGARLLPDARFCHKCGRPVKEPEPLREPAAEPASFSPPPPPPPETQIGFHNGAAVRTGLLAGALGLALSSIPLSPWIPLVSLMGAGVLAVYLYNRRTGQALAVRSGIRLGWMTGLFAFVFSLVLMTISLALIAGKQEALERVLQEQSAFSPEMVARMAEVLRNPVQLGVALLFGFVSFSLTAALGGALGARLFGKQ